ncbi:MAG: NifB/NifX family molybdenum-iron cluster-binding protein [Syntrophobacteraceae bacterium]
MLAIPVFRDRVAPVFDWCSKIIIVPEKEANAASSRQIDVKENTFKLMRSLREQGIGTLICGALSPEILNYGESIGLKIVHGVAGEIEEVLQAYRDQKLDQPQYWLPGCQGQRRYKAGARCAGKGKDGMVSEEGSRGSGTGPARRDAGGQRSKKGAGGFCICPKCGAKKEHERGIPCSHITCASCHSMMVRE